MSEERKGSGERRGERDQHGRLIHWPIMAPGINENEPLDWPQGVRGWTGTVCLTYEIEVEFETNPGENAKRVAVDDAVEAMGAGAGVLVHTEIGVLKEQGQEEEE